MRISTRLICGLSAILFLAATLAPGDEACAPLTKDQEAALCHYVQRKYRLPEGAQVIVSAVSNVGETCYRKLRFQTADPRPRFDVSFYLTPDHRFLVPELNDSAVDPIAEEARRVAAVRQEIEGDDGASLGPADAAVTIVVFSDFQCPFCKRFADTLKDVLLDGEIASHVRVVYRNMPISPTFAVASHSRGSGGANSFSSQCGYPKTAVVKT